MRKIRIVGSMTNSPLRMTKNRGGKEIKWKDPTMKDLIIIRLETLIIRETEIQRHHEQIKIAGEMIN